MNSSAFQRAIRLTAQPNASSIELAKALWAAEKHRPGSLRQFVTMHPRRKRRAYYLFAIWERFARLDIPEQELARVGWTKLQLIVQHCEEGTELGGIDLALRYTTAELKHALRSKHHPSRKSYSLLFRLSPSQYKVVRAALLKHGAKPSKNGRGLNGKEKALTRALKAEDC